MTADHPTPAEIRERAKGPLHEALHTLEPRIPNLNVGDCHCNLLAEVALDALMPMLAELARRDAALADLTRQRDRLLLQAGTGEVEIDQLRADVEHLRARLVEDREAAEAQVAATKDAIVELIKEQVRLIGQRDEAQGLLFEASDAWHAAEAQLERQAPVIGAARALVEGWKFGLVGNGGTALRAAVDALGPVDPEATDGL